MTISKMDLDALRGLVGRVGADEASKLIGVHKTSLISALAGLPIRPRTEQDIKAALEQGVTDSPTRGEQRGHAPKTKRRS